MSETTIKKIKRSEFATFLNTAPGEAAASFKRMGKGITSQTVSYNPATTAETYIDENSATTSVDSYAVNISTPQTCYVGEPIFEFIDKLRKARATGADCETELLMVYVYDTAEANKYTAEKVKCTIQIDDFGGDGGGNLTINYTINLNGDPEIGTATISNGVATFTAAAA